MCLPPAAAVPAACRPLTAPARGLVDEQTVSKLTEAIPAPALDQGRLGQSARVAFARGDQSCPP